MPQERLWLGHPTGSAMPLVWAHAEYLTLVRSAVDGQVFDYLPEVAARYQTGRPRPNFEIWKPNRHVRSMAAPGTLRVQAPADFLLHWTIDEWRHSDDTPSKPTGLSVHYVDIPLAAGQRAPLRFSFYWPATGRWEGRDYMVCVAPPV